MDDAKCREVLQESLFNLAAELKLTIEFIPNVE